VHSQRFLQASWELRQGVPTLASGPLQSLRPLVRDNNAAGLSGCSIAAEVISFQCHSMSYFSSGLPFVMLQAWGRRTSNMVASDSFAEFLREQLAPLGRLTLRRMFGKTGVFCDGFMLGMVRDNTLYFRVDDENRVAFKEAQSFPPLNYEKRGGTIDLSFWRAPERLFDEPDELLTWGRTALAAARRVAAKRDRAAPRRRFKPQST
jgi:DNA transformation protein